MSHEHAFWAAFVQFLVLGTLGEVMSAMIRARAVRFPFRPAKLVLKALSWGVLGVYIKVMFLVGDAGVRSLVDHGVLPGAFADRATTLGLLSSALAMSTLVNVMLGPAMMGLHRLADNAIDRALGDPPLGWSGMGHALATLIWLWIPLHTLTFTQPPALRVGIAALLSLVLGLVMGWFARRAVVRVSRAGPA